MVDKCHYINCIIFIREHTAASGQGTVRFAPFLCMYMYTIVWGSTVCDSVLAFLCDTMEEELLHLPRLPYLDRSRYFSVRSVFQWRGMRLV